MSDPILELPFFAGIDESTRDELVKPGSGWAELTNVRQENHGSVVKRLGYEPLTRSFLGGGSSSSGYRLFDHNGQISEIVESQSVLISYSEAAGANILHASLPECSARVIDVPGFAVCDSEYCNGFIALAYGLQDYTTNLSTIMVAVVDTSGAVVLPVQDPGAGATTTSTIHLASYGNRYFVMVHKDRTIDALWFQTLDTQNLAAGWSALTLITSAVGTVPSVCSLSDRVAIAYAKASGTDLVGVTTVNASGVIASTTINTSTTFPDFVSIHGSSAGTLWVAWEQALEVKIIGLAPTTLAVTATTDTALTGFSSMVHLDVVEGPTNQARVLGLDSGDNELFRASVVITAGAAVATSMTSLIGVGPASRPFYFQNRHYIASYSGAQDFDDSGDNTQALCVVVDWTNDEAVARPVANLMPGLVVGRQFWGKFIALSATRLAYAFEVARTGSTDLPSVQAGNGTSGAALAVLDFADRSRWRSVSHNRRTFLGGGVTTTYDGDAISEVGFLSRPSKPTTSLGGTGITGTYRYVAVFEDIDASGVRTVSGISDPSDVVSPANDTVTVSTDGIGLTYRIGSARLSPTRTRVVFYRTATGGEPPYYRVGSVACAGAAAVSISDAMSDALLTDNSKLYAPNLPSTLNEALDRRAPPGLLCLESFNGMLVGCFGSSLYYSGQEVYGEATWFSPVFQLPISGDGDFTALKAQDGTLYAFKETCIYAVPGDAPTDNGMTGGLGSPRKLAVDVGCIEPASVVSTSLGIFFQSRRGIELLNRGGSVTPIGEKVQTTLATYPIISSAVLDDRNGLVRFTLAASESSGQVSGSGRDLIFDLSINEWQSVDNKVSNASSQDACMVTIDGVRRYAWLATNGTVYFERLSTDSDAYLDGSSWVTQRAVTPWVAIAGLNGEQFVDQVLLLAKRFSDHALTISVAFDFSDIYQVANIKTFTYSQIAALAREWLVKEITQTTSQSVRVKLEDATPGSGGIVGPGKGAVWVALTFNGQPHRGPKRTSGAQRGG